MKWKIWLIFRKRGSLTTTLVSPVIVLDGEPAEPFEIRADTRDAAAAQEAINRLYETLTHQQRTQFSRVLEAVVAAQERRRTGAGMIAQERLRQIHEEDWDAEHDDAHDRGELTSAALAYLAFVDGSPAEARSLWPFEARFWKPSDEDSVRDLVKAGALIAAEIDRLLRQKVANEQTEVRL